MLEQERKRATRLPVTVREAGVDGWSEVRNLHATSLRAVSGSVLDGDQLVAYLNRVYAPDYTSALQAQSLLTVWYEDRLVATAGWLPADDAGLSARITSVFVSPLYWRMGLGRQIVGAIEERAKAAGFYAFSARVLPSALSFFEAIGYQRSSLGVVSLGTLNGVPVVFIRKGQAIVPESRISKSAAGAG
ncbi:MAG: GNAT family N-acetyltransferase [Hyphomicrobiaceae bacterium]